MIGYRIPLLGSSQVFQAFLVLSCFLIIFLTLSLFPLLIHSVDVIVVYLLLMNCRRLIMLLVWPHLLPLLTRLLLLSCNELLQPCLSKEVVCFLGLVWPCIAQGIAFGTGSAIAPCAVGAAVGAMSSGDGGEQEQYERQPVNTMQQQQLYWVCALEKQMFLNACKSTRAIKRIVPFCMKIFSNTNTMQTKSHLAKQNLVVWLPWVKEVEKKSWQK
jgi:hypothetical protein